MSRDARRIRLFGGVGHISEEDFDMCLYLYDDPDGRPYNNSDFERALEARGLLEYVDFVRPKRFSSVWVLKLKTTEGKQTVANVRSLYVKGLYCAIVDPCLEDTCIKVHWVPFGIPDETLRIAFRRFGIVKEVVREKVFEDIESTTRHITISLKGGIRKEDLPHLWELDGKKVHISIPGRPRGCLVCGGPCHVRDECPVKECDVCGRDLSKDHICVLPYPL